MSSRVKDNIHFFNLLLVAHPAQQKALLTTASNQQLDFLSELMHNIKFTLPLTAEQRKRLQRKTFLTELANIKRSYNFRKQRAKRYAPQLIKLFSEFAAPLRQVAEDAARHAAGQIA